MSGVFWVPLSPPDERGWEEDRAAGNLVRTRWAMMAGLPLHLGFVLAFGLEQVAEGPTGRWRSLIFTSHALVLAVVAPLLVLLWRRRADPTLAWVVPPAVSAGYLTLGSVVASFDQLVTTAISPLLVVNITVALLLRVRPPTAVAHHLLSVAVFSLLQPSFQADVAIRFSNAANAASMGLISALVSVAFTAFQRRDYAQRRTIERQRDELEGAFARMQALAERADAANQAKSQFLATMSHEIRTPLNGVLGVAELLGATPLREDQRRLVTAVSDAGSSLLTIINDLLDFSKIEAGQMTLEQVPVDVRALTEEVRELFAGRAQEQGLTLEVVWAQEGPAWLAGDPTRLKQVLSNLVANAVKFTERGGIRVEVAITPRGGQAQLSVAVVDSGIGLNAGQQARLFAPFVQADASTTRRFGGTGLGLAICKRLVEQMGGTIGVTSSEGHGSRFWFELTLPTCAPTAFQSAGSGGHRAFAARVLLAEDNPVNVLVARGMMTRLGLEVLVATDGAQALALVPTAGVDLVFTDLHMPELDGFELARRLRAGGCTVPIIALTADAMPEDRQRCLDVGMNDYVSKPFKQADLARVLTRWLRPQSSGQAPATSAA